MKRLIRKILRSAGYSVRRYNPGSFLGVDPFRDIEFFLSGTKCPTILDVGANDGESVDSFKAAFPDSLIHSFEPSPTTYARLRAHCGGLAGVKTWNYGVAAREGTLPLIEQNLTRMSSFLPPDEYCWGKPVKTTDVKVLTLDSFTDEQNIEFVHVLKSDTQGYDFEVFKGAEGLMRQNRIALIYFEFTFSKMYQDLPSFPEVFTFLTERNFSLVCFYDPHFQRDLISWTDMLFINRDFNCRRAERLSP